MKLLSFEAERRASFGVIQNSKIMDLGIRLKDRAPDLLSAIRDIGLAEFKSLADDFIADYSIDDVSFLPVIPNPGKIICAGLNYVAHRLEGNHKPAGDAPPLFLRLAQSQVGHAQPIVRPLESGQLDFEAELAVVIGKPGRRILQTEALSHVFGMSCYNDASVRDWQLATSQWTPGKNFPKTGAFGPWIVTSDELSPAQPLKLVCRLNGHEMQRATTDLMIFPIDQLISYISKFVALEPGDVIVTGTPGGVGHRRTPPVWMKEGDVIEVEVEGIGVLQNPIIDEI